MPRGPQYSEEELLEDLRELAERLSRTPTKSDMNEYGSHGGRTYQLRFGSWSEAVEAAGFEPRSPGEDFEERPDACPLCGVEATGLDYHHWRYTDGAEVGCYLCRGCHDRVHEGEAQRENPDWLVHCVANLVEAHANHHPDELAVDAIIDRYNMTDVQPLVERELENTS